MHTGEPTPLTHYLPTYIPYYPIYLTIKSPIYLTLLTAYLTIYLPIYVTFTYHVHYPPTLLTTFILTYLTT